MNVDVQTVLGLGPVARDCLSMDPLAGLPCWYFWSLMASLEAPDGSLIGPALHICEGSYI